MKLTATTIENRAAAEVDNFQRVRTLVSDPADFTARFRTSMESVATPLAAAIVRELNSRERAA